MMLNISRPFSLLLAAFFLCASLSFSTAHAAGLRPLSDSEMGNVTGQEGILVSVDYYYNSSPVDNSATANFDESGQALIGSGASGTQGDGGCSTPGTTGSLADMDCRLGLQLANRTNNWLVFKNGHASLEMNRLSLDASYLGDAGSSANTAYFNEDKFRGVSPDGGVTPGNCLLGTGNCTTSYIKKMPAVRNHYPETGGVYCFPGNSYAGCSGADRSSLGFNDVRLGVYVEGVAVENNNTGQDAWQYNNLGSFLGVNIADNNGNQARIAVGGDFYMYGF